MTGVQTCALPIYCLLDNDFQIWLTSDHGNIECFGEGQPREGSTAEIRGERVRVYPTQELLVNVKANFPFTIEWNPIGLPKNYYPLIASEQNAFIKKDERIVGHGGITIEEVLVPFIKIERRQL